MKLAILTIGDEICIGQIENTNAGWIARECAAVGLRIVAHSAVGDHDEHILTEFDRLLAMADVLLVTGGLGPTHDDRTKDCLLRYFEDRLVLHEESLRLLTEKFEQRGYEITERQRAQAMLPAKCEALVNPYGTAPGMLFRRQDGKLLVSMPGVPVEMKYLMREYVLPLLERESSADPVMMYRTLRTTGIPEGTLADRIGDLPPLLEGQSLAFLPSWHGVRLRISVSATDRAAGSAVVKRIEERLRARVGRYIYGEDDDSLASVVGELLRRCKQTLAVAESCTGGLLGKLLTDIAGSSDYFMGGVLVYSNEAKVKQLHVSPATLRDHGAVSEATARELAANVRREFTTDYGIGITGVAGPGGGSAAKPVGTIWIGLASAEGVEARKFLFAQDRGINRERAAAAALAMLYRQLTRGQD